MEAPKLEDLNAQNTQEKSIRKRYPEFHEYILKTYPQDLRWPEKLYLYYHPGEVRRGCIVCGKPTKLINIREGWKGCCSMRCAGRSPEMLEKRARTNKERYGVENPFSSKEIQEKIKTTNLEKYGVENPNQSPEIQAKSRATNLERYGVEVVTKSESVKKKIRETNLERYGVGTPLASPELRAKGIETCREKYGTDHPMQNEDIKEQVRQTNLRKYGYEVSSQAPEVKAKAAKTNLDRYGSTCPITELKTNKVLSENPDIVCIHKDENGDTIYTCRCPHPDTCNKCEEKTYNIPSPLYWNRRNGGVEPCLTLLPRGLNSISSLELKVREWLDEMGISYETNVRTIIPPHEVDIWIPEKNIAIEVNGCYWHSDINRPDPNYHIDKFLDAHKAGIRLYQLWEDWFINKEDLLHSMIENWCGVNETLIGARECRVEEIKDRKISRDFLNYNHIQGYSPASLPLGLYYKDQLVSLMTFSRCRGVVGNAHKNRESWELVRFCSLRGCTIRGGASRLLSHFRKTHPDTHLISYSSGDISTGRLYSTLGFQSDYKISPSYWYIDPLTMTRYHRSSFTKSAIVSRGWKDRIDSSWTERQVMEERGFLRIYDAGVIRWEID